MPVAQKLLLNKGILNLKPTGPAFQTLTCMPAIQLKTKFARFLFSLIGLASVLLLLLNIGCSKSYRPRTASEDITVTEQGMIIIDVGLLDMILAAREAVGRAAGVDASFQLIPDSEPNAYVTLVEERPTIFLNLGIVEMIGRNRDHYAFLFAHEYAHLRQGHLSAQLKRDERLDKIGGAIIGGIEILGMAVGIPLGVFSMFSVDSGTHLVALKYDRDQEREADTVALDLMQNAGYDPCGALSFHRKLEENSKKISIPLLSTHPTGEERISRIRSILVEKGLLAQSP